MRRRDLLQTLAGATAVVSLARAASAQKSTAGAGVLTVPEYLARAAILLDETRRAQDWVGGHPGDLGLAELALELSQARADVATVIAAPTEVKQAHMHLLLTIENTTASFDLTVRGDAKKAAQRMAAARMEEQTLMLALDAAKVKMPTLP